MTKSSFIKNLMLHIRYPWTALCLLILWVGLAIMCAILHFSTDDVIILISIASGATLLIAFMGFRS